jgi:hypothetical protein
MAKENTKMDMAQDKAMVKKAVGIHDKQMHGGKKTDMSSLKKGGCTKMAFGGAAKAAGNAVNAIKAQGAANPSMVKPAGAPPGRAGAAMPRPAAPMPRPAGLGAAMPRPAAPMPRPAGLGSVVKGSTGPGTIRRAKGGSVSSRADGCATKGKTKGKII